MLTMDYSRGTGSSLLFWTEKGHGVEEHLIRHSAGGLGQGEHPFACSPCESDFTKEMARLERPIAAQHAAAIMLAEAGLLQGKKFASPPNPTYQFVGGVHGGEGVIRDGSIITGSHDRFVVDWFAARSQDVDDTTRDLTRVFIEALKE